MKNLFLVISFFLILFSCKKYNSNSDSSNSKKDSEIDSATTELDSIFNASHKDINAVPYEEPKDGYYTKDYKDGDLKAKVYYRRKENDVRYYRIDFFKNSKKIQTINQEPEDLFNAGDDFGLTFEDANFDGKKDILILKFVGMNFDEQFLFLNEGEKYVKYKKFEEITSPVIDSKNKEITSDYRSGSDYFSMIYKWKKGKLIKVSESSYDEDHPD